MVPITSSDQFNKIYFRKFGFCVIIWWMNLTIFKKLKQKYLNNLALTLSLCAVLFFVQIPAFAETVDDLKSQKDQIQLKLKAINQQIQSFQGQLDSTRKQQASLKNEIFLYDTQIKSTELQIQAKETQADDANLQIKEIQAQIERRNVEIEDNKKLLKELIVQLNELDANSFLNIGLGNGNFSEFLDQLEYTQNVQGRVYQIVENIKSVRARLQTQQTELEIQVKKLEELQEQLRETQDSLEYQRGSRQGLLDKTRGVERNYQKLLVASKNEEANLEKEINDLDNSIRAKLGKRTISAKKGVLAYPMDGVMTQSYGNTGFTALGYNFHNGIDLAGPAATPVYAAADGSVVAADTGEAAYGNWVAIKHSVSTKNGTSQIITLYAHLRQFKVKVGQSVKMGDLIGYEGNTGNTTRLLYGPERGYHLHFTVFDAEGFAVQAGKFASVYGHYSVPYGYTYNPLDFLQ